MAARVEDSSHQSRQAYHQRPCVYTVPVDAGIFSQAVQVHTEALGWWYST